MTSFKLLLTFTILVANITFGQFSNFVSFNSYSYDNLYRTPVPIQDILSTVKVGLNYQKPESNTQFYNNTSLIVFNNIADRNFLINNVGINKNIKINEKLNSNLRFGGDWTLRINKDNYNYYNYSQLSGYANFQILTNIALIKGGYNYRWRNYTNWSDLSNNLHNAFLQLNKSFPSRTTVIVETGFGNKSYVRHDTFATTGDFGRGRGWHHSEEMSTTNTVSERLGTSQANIILRLTQSLHERAGIYFQYRKQISISDETNYRNFDDYYQDNELFDDPFTYESDNYSSQLTIMLPKSTKLLISGSLASKNYISEQAYSTATDTVGIGELRLDEQTNYFIDLSKTFNINKDWVTSIKFNLYYSYVNNESNSYWYNYKNNALGGGIQWIF